MAETQEDIAEEQARYGAVRTLCQELPQELQQVTLSLLNGFERRIRLLEGEIRLLRAYQIHSGIPALPPPPTDQGKTIRFWQELATNIAGKYATRIGRDTQGEGPTHEPPHAMGGGEGDVGREADDLEEEQTNKNPKLTQETQWTWETQHGEETPIQLAPIVCGGVDVGTEASNPQDLHLPMETPNRLLDTFTPRESHSYLQALHGVLTNASAGYRGAARYPGALDYPYGSQESGSCNHCDQGGW